MEKPLFPSSNWILLDKSKKIEIVEYVRKTSSLLNLELFSEIFSNYSTEFIVDEINKLLANSVTKNCPMKALGDGIEAFIPCIVLACEWNTFDDKTKEAVLPVLKEKLGERFSRYFEEILEINS